MLNNDNDSGPYQRKFRNNWHAARQVANYSGSGLNTIEKRRDVYIVDTRLFKSEKSNANNGSIALIGSVRLASPWGGVDSTLCERKRFRSSLASQSS